MLTLNRTIEDNLFEFVDDGWLFNYMDEIDFKLKDYKEKALVDKEHSNRNEIYVILELDSSKYELTETFKVEIIEEFKDFYDKVTEDIKNSAP